MPSCISAQKAGDCRKMHLVAKKETVYGISKQYGITEDELRSANPSIVKKGLKKGEYICIPYSRAEIEEAERAERERMEQAAAAERALAKKNERLNFAVILPFAASQSAQGAEGQRMADFYRGILLVVDSLKQAGVNIDVQAYDEVSTHISTILQTPSLRQADFIIGPGKTSSIDAVAAFANQNQIPLVVPFSSQASISAGRRYVFQSNPQTSIHYQRVFNKFISSHRGDNIIFVGVGDNSDNADYVIAFKKALTDNGISFSRMSLADLNKSGASAFSTQKNNVVIPSSPTAHTFDNICTEINEMNLPETTRVQMFGYPEWEAFAQRSSANMAKYRAQFFTPYYGNNVSSRTSAFNRLYQSAFKRQPVVSSIRYAEMGHDLAAFFLTCRQKYGKDFSGKVQSHDYNSIHQPYHFVQNDQQGGFVNEAYYLITYKTDGNIQLIAY